MSCYFVFLQASQAIVSLEAVLGTLGALKLHAHADSVAAHLCDKGFEDDVPISSLVQLLRDAGVPPARAVAVKNTVLRSIAPPVS